MVSSASIESSRNKFESRNSPIEGFFGDTEKLKRESRGEADPGNCVEISSNRL
jgi:hypothetical protein